jgi:hypothetical protein
MSCALRVKFHHKVKFYPPAEGQQNGAGKSSPLRFLLHGRARLCLLFLLSLRGIVGALIPLTPPVPLAAKCSKSMAAPVRTATPCLG